MGALIVSGQRQFIFNKVFATTILFLLMTSCSKYVVQSLDPSSIYDFPEEHRVESLPALNTGRAKSRVLILGDIGVNAGCYRHRYGQHASACRRLHRDVLAVLDEARNTCTKDDGKRCDVAVLLGDNVYKGGVTAKAKESFLMNLLSKVHETSRKTLVVLGNHDWGSPTELVLKMSDKHSHALAQLRLLASPRAARLGVLSSTLFWGINIDSAHLVGIDAQYLALTHEGDKTSASEKTHIVNNALIRLQKDAAPHTWRIAFGHHNYLSDGRGHGDVGASRNWLGAVGVGYKGTHFKQFMDDFIVPTFDLYATGHEHSLQFFDEIKTLHGSADSGAAQLLVGSSGKVNTSLRTPSEAKSSRGYSSDYARAVLAFAILEISSERLLVRGYRVMNNDQGHCSDLEFVSVKTGSSSSPWTTALHKGSPRCH